MEQKELEKVAFLSGLKEIILIRTIDVAVDVFETENLKGEMLCMVRGLGEGSNFLWLSNDQLSAFRNLQKAWATKKGEQK